MQLTKWRQYGERLIVCMDAKEDIYRKSIGKALVKTDGLNMIEAVDNYTGQQLGAAFFKGVKPIDGVWVTSDVQVAGACVMPAGYGIATVCLWLTF